MVFQICRWRLRNLRPLYRQRHHADGTTPGPLPTGWPSDASCNAVPTDADASRRLVQPRESVGRRPLDTARVPIHQPTSQETDFRCSASKFFETQLRFKRSQKCILRSFSIGKKKQEREMLVQKITQKNVSLIFKL